MLVISEVIFPSYLIWHFTLLKGSAYSNVYKNHEQKYLAKSLRFLYWNLILTLTC